MGIEATEETPAEPQIPELVDSNTAMRAAKAEAADFAAAVKQGMDKLGVEDGKEGDGDDGNAELAAAAKAAMGGGEGDEDDITAPAPKVVDAKPKEGDEPSLDEEEDLPEITRKPPAGAAKRIREKRKQAELKAQYEARETELQQQMASLQERFEEEVGGHRRMMKLFKDGDLDAALKEAGFTQGMADAQRRYLETKGALKSSKTDLPEDVRKELDEARKLREEFEAERRQREENRAQQEAQAERQQLLDAVEETISSSKFKQIRALREHADEPTKTWFREAVLQSMQLNPDEEDDKVHLRAAWDGLQTTWNRLQVLAEVFSGSATQSRGSTEQPHAAGAGKPKVAPTTEKTETRTGLPGQPGESAGKQEARASRTLSQSQSTEARGKTAPKVFNQDDERKAFNAMLKPFMDRTYR